MPDATDRSGALYPLSWSLPGSAERNAPPIASALAPILSSASSSSSIKPIDVLELASGFGIQLAHIASECSNARFWPTEADERLKGEIDSTMAEVRKTRGEAGALGNVSPAALLEVDKQDHWRAAALRISKAQRLSRGQDDRGDRQPILGALIAINFTQVVPWDVTRSLFAHVDPRLRYMAYKPRLEGGHSHGQGQEAEDEEEEGEMIERPLLDPVTGLVMLYGPFKRDGKLLSEGDEKFDATLRARDQAFGLRDLEGEIIPLAKQHGWQLGGVKDMPAGNFLVTFRPVSR